MIKLYSPLASTIHLNLSWGFMLPPPAPCNAIIVPFLLCLPCQSGLFLPCHACLYACRFWFLLVFLLCFFPALGVCVSLFCCCCCRLCLFVPWRPLLISVPCFCTVCYLCLFVPYCPRVFPSPVYLLSVISVFLYPVAPVSSRLVISVFSYPVTLALPPFILFPCHFIVICVSSYPVTPVFPQV